MKNLFIDKSTEEIRSCFSDILNEVRIDNSLLISEIRHDQTFNEATDFILIYQRFMEELAVFISTKLNFEKDKCFFIIRAVEKASEHINEIYLLISNNYFRGTIGIIRSLMETTAITKFLSISDDETANRYKKWGLRNIIRIDKKVFTLMKKQRLDLNEIEKNNFESNINLGKEFEKEYNESFKNDYGWAIIDGKQVTSISEIYNAINLDGFSVQSQILNSEIHCTSHCLTYSKVYNDLSPEILFLDMFLTTYLCIEKLAESLLILIKELSEKDYEKLNEVNLYLFELTTKIIELLKAKDNAKN